MLAEKGLSAHGQKEQYLATVTHAHQSYYGPRVIPTSPPVYAPQRYDHTQGAISSYLIPPYLRGEKRLESGAAG